MNSPLAVINCKITGYSNLDFNIKYHYNSTIFNISEELYNKYEKPFAFGFSPLKDDRTIIHAVISDLSVLPFVLIHFMYLIRKNLQLKNIDLKMYVSIGEANFKRDAKSSDLGIGEAYNNLNIYINTMKNDWFFGITTTDTILKNRIGSVINTINYNLRGDQSLLDQVIDVIDEGRYKIENPESINKKNIHQHAKEILNGLFYISKELQEYVLDILHEKQLGFKKDTKLKLPKENIEEKKVDLKKDYSNDNHTEKIKPISTKKRDNKTYKRKNNKTGKKCFIFPLIIVLLPLITFILRNISNNVDFLIKISSILIAISIGLLILYIINCLIKWKWLIKHSNSYGLQSCIFMCSALVFIGIFVEQWQNIFWLAILSFIAIIPQLLGGPKKRR